MKTKPHYIWNHTWKFWAKNGGPIGYIWKDGRWDYCWIEPEPEPDGTVMLMGFPSYRREG